MLDHNNKFIGRIYTYPQYVREADCYVIVYSITDANSFQEAQAMYGWTTRIRDKPMPAVSS